MIEQIKKNLDFEIAMVRELNRFYEWYENSAAEEKRLYARMMNSLVKRVRLLNDSLPKLLESVSLIKKLDSPAQIGVTRISLQREVDILVSDRGKEEFLRELNISEKLLKKVKTQQSKISKKSEGLQTPNVYGKIANKIFLGMSQRLVDEGSFKTLRLNVRKSNINILSTTYISMMLFSTLVMFFIGVLAMTFFIFFELNLLEFSLKLYAGNYLIRFLKLLWLPLGLPLLAWFLFHTYPSAEKNALGKRIDQELPFAVIHMGSIAGSGIEPAQIFKIVAMGNEYPFAGQEFRKILNQINLYGYDLGTALRNVSLSTSSVRLAELLNGISVTINVGGDINKFFEKRAESLLLEYRLEREKSIKTAETFMDLYISVVIATPMILLMLMVIIAVSKVQTGFNPGQLNIAIIGIVAIVNILFLAFLHIKQPTY
ncbi:MAG: type II secretion system F family protein [Nanoarchaeota archaeon]